jgi:hypothetical protein
MRLPGRKSRPIAQMLEALLATWVCVSIARVELITVALGILYKGHDPFLNFANGFPPL